MSQPDILVEPWEAEGRDGNRLVGNIYLPVGGTTIDRSVLLLHGGGQTRHAWSSAATNIARRGYRAIALDQRGHGDSDWDREGRYAFSDFGEDLQGVAAFLTGSDCVPPTVVGASLGGIASLLAQGASETLIFSAMVFVDITPNMRADGVSKIEAFMRHRAHDGFVSVEQAADAVARYLPHRPRPMSAAGLRKNLRQRSDGRWYWHWDPQFLDGPRPVRHNPNETQMVLNKACERISQPALVIRGRESELIEPHHIDAFRARVPHLESIELDSARHMVAGDQNDAFTEAVIDFLARVSKQD